MTDRALSLSAIGHGRPIDVVLNEAAATQVSNVQIAIGATPVRSLPMKLYCSPYWKDASFHHAVPIGRNVTYRPDSNAEFDAMIQYMHRELWHNPAPTYSMHPPTISQVMNWQAFLDWVKHRIEYAGEFGIKVAFETMFVGQKNSTRHLYSPGYVNLFARWLHDQNYSHGLVVDVSHCHIAKWTMADFSMLPRNCIAEVHYSSNNGKYDQHKQIVNGSYEAKMLSHVMQHFDVPLMVDEGRRKP
jgi:hypothetical protein